MNGSDLDSNNCPSFEILRSTTAAGFPAFRFGTTPPTTRERGGATHCTTDGSKNTAGESTVPKRHVRSDVFMKLDAPVARIMVPPAEGPRLTLSFSSAIGLCGRNVADELSKSTRFLETSTGNGSDSRDDRSGVTQRRASL